MAQEGSGPGAWVAALDGGGTKTAAALADRWGEVVVLPQGAGCNPQDGPGWDAVLREMLGAVLQARGGVVALVLGMPGHGEVPAQDAATDALLRDLLPVPFETLNDVALAHRGAFGGGEGVLVLSGTGSMAWAHGPRRDARVGGWGDVLGDEGSAAWIGREALALAARALDGRTPEALPFAQALVERLGRGAEGPFAPLAWLMAQPGTPRAAAASVARKVDALSRAGNGDAIRLMEAAAGELALAARVVAQQVGLPPGFAWIASGGAFRSEVLGQALAQALGRPAEPARLTALAGGLLRAAEMAGWAPDQAWTARVDAQLRA